MDVWFFHNHDILNDTEKRQSTRNLKYFEDRYGLKNYNQKGVGIKEPFDDAISGNSKGSLLKFVTSHREYDYAWMAEDDVMITGDWRSFFERFESDDADFVSKQVEHKRDWYWYHHDCKIDEDYISEENLNHTGNLNHKAQVKCDEILNWAALWPLIRVSKQAAKHLMEDLLSGLIQGHHEAMVQAIILKHPTLKFRTIPSDVANVMAGSWDPCKDSAKLKLDMFQPVSMGKVYHPVKCEANKDLAGMEEFERHMKDYGWKKHGTAIV
ncbi:hypothetical protein IV203_008198 [Nitzschia inconspicua]|uniref:Uncharacterized protein n=1 Tax=Nitzschia inconspicua TaxID=303405 RepID=A0A9K3PLQ7_9STRA|nr:hypothetical protein IV203_011077 [Nitzschia inconspicua]KAG7352150.1 hypothetical protein IV203_008198 [Nitzschia inconspicua]